MFLFHLNPEERRAFVGLAKQLIAADARERPDEVGVLRLMERELGIPVAELPATPPRADVLATFSSQASRVAVLMELLTLAYADGEPHPEEMGLLETIAASFGVPELRLLAMEDWIVRQLSLNAEANAFLDEDDGE